MAKQDEKLQKADLVRPLKFPNPATVVRPPSNQPQCGCNPNAVRIIIEIPCGMNPNVFSPQPTYPNPSGSGGGVTAVPQKLIIDKLIMHRTPQTGTWLMCFQASVQGGSSAVFHIPDQTYSGDGTQIDMGLVLNGVNVGQTVSFHCNLDDDEADVCANSAEDKSSGDFTVSVQGSHTFDKDNFTYTIYWHME